MSTTRKNYEVLVGNYEATAVEHSFAEQKFGEIEQRLGSSLRDVSPVAVWCVLRTIFRASGDPFIHSLQNECLQYIDLVIRINEVNANDKPVGYNKNGSPTFAEGRRVEECNGLLHHTVGVKSKSGDAVLTLLERLANLDVADLVQVASLSILNETAKAVERAKDKGEALAVGFLSEPYIIKQPCKRVIINNSEITYREVQTCGMKEVMREIRRAIMKSRSVEVHNGKYVYLDALESDEELPAEERIYKRLSRLTASLTLSESECFASVTDVPVLTATIDEVEWTENIIKSLKLNPRQEAILRLRLGGDGYKKIADKMKMTPPNVLRTLKQIGAKYKKLKADEQKSENP